MMNRHQGDIFLQYQKGELSKEEATDKIIHCALKSKRQLFKQCMKADMHNLRTSAERKKTKRFTPSTYNQHRTIKKNKNGSEKRKRCKIRQAESEREKEDKI